MTKTSVIWDYFQESGDLEICKKCTTTYMVATVKSSTQPLRYHLKTKHGFTDERLKRPRTSSVGVNSPKRQKPITKKSDFFTNFIDIGNMNFQFCLDNPNFCLDKQIIFICKLSR